MITRFDTIHVTDGRTDGPTLHDGNSRPMHSIARQKSFEGERRVERKAAERRVG